MYSACVHIYIMQQVLATHTLTPDRILYKITVHTNFLLIRRLALGRQPLVDLVDYPTEQPTIDNFGHSVSSIYNAQ